MLHMQIYAELKEVCYGRLPVGVLSASNQAHRIAPIRPHESHEFQSNEGGKKAYLCTIVHIYNHID